MWPMKKKPPLHKHSKKMEHSWSKNYSPNSWPIEFRKRIKRNQKTLKQKQKKQKNVFLVFVSMYFGTILNFPPNLKCFLSLFSGLSRFSHARSERKTRKNRKKQKKTSQEKKRNSTNQWTRGALTHPSSTTKNKMVNV